MIVFHIDKFGDMPLGDVKLGGYTEKYRENLRYYQENFPEGVSVMGANFVADRELDSDETLAAINEVIFEYVRQLHFPSLPSRFQCLFGSETLENAYYWEEIVAPKQKFPNSKIRKIESENLFVADATWRDIRPYGGKNKYVFSPGVTYDSAMNYWSGIFNVNLPAKKEVLIGLPAFVIE